MQTKNNVIAKLYVIRSESPPTLGNPFLADHECSLGITNGTLNMIKGEVDLCIEKSGLLQNKDS